MTFRFNFLMLISVLAGINQKCIGRSFGDSLNYISLDKIDIGGHLGNKIDWCIQNRIVEQSVGGKPSFGVNGSPRRSPLINTNPLLL